MNGTTLKVVGGALASVLIAVGGWMITGQNTNAAKIRDLEMLTGEQNGTIRVIENRLGNIEKTQNEIGETLKDIEKLLNK